MSRAGPVAALAAVLAVAPAAAARAQAAYEQLQTFSSVLNHIRANYVDTVTTEHLVRSAIAGMLGALDPHSHFQPRAEAERLAAWRAGQLAAAGLVVEEVDGAITVLAVYPGSPAARTGIVPGDRIVSVNDTSTLGQSAATVQARLIGDRGSRVRLLLERGSRLEPQPVEVTVRLDFVRPRTVGAVRALAADVGYVRLEEFLPGTGREVHQAVERALRGGRQALILDLRGNPGGIVDAAVDVASEFLPSERTVFRTRGRHRDLNREFRTQRNGDFRNVPMVVLVDEGTASAAEALAGALQDHDRALVLGRRSFGKALMQRVFDVPPAGDLVWLTVGYVLTPSGRLIQRPYRGLTPAQYYRLAGRTEGDTASEYRTDGGRMVRAGGGILPDSVLPGPPPPPPWYPLAAERNIGEAVADSVAHTLAADDAARERWLISPAEWEERLLAPFVARVRAGLAVRATPDSAAAAHIGRLLAARAATVRWGADAGETLLLRTDPDLVAALTLLPRARELFGAGRR